MAGRTITQRIQLVGGEAIKNAFEAIGTAGKKAFAQIADAKNAESSLTKLGTSLSAVKARLESMRSAGGGLGSSFGGLSSAVGSVGARLGTLVGGGLAAAAVGFVNLASAAGEAQEALENNAAAIGASAEKFDEWQKIADLNGVSGEKFGRAMIKLNAAMHESAAATKRTGEEQEKLRLAYNSGKLTYSEYTAKQAEINRRAEENKTVFQKLGVAVTDSGGKFRDTFDVYQDFGKAVGGVKNSVEAAGYSLSVFGTRAAPLVNMTRMTAAELQKQREEVQRLAPTLQKAEREGLDTFADRLNWLGKASETARFKLLAVFAPSMTTIVNGMIERVVALRDKYLSIAEVMAGKFAPIAEDIAAALSGKGEIKNDSIRAFVEDFKSAAQDVATAAAFMAGAIGSAVSFIKGALDGIANIINAVFGTKLTGGVILAGLALAKFSGVLGVVTAGARVLASVWQVLSVSLLATPFARLVALFFTLGFAITKFVIDSGGIQKAWQRVMDALPGITRAAWNIVVTILRGVGYVIVEGFKGTWDLVVKGAQAVPGILAQMWRGAGKLIALGFSGLGALLKIVWDGIAADASETWQIIKDSGAVLWNGIVGLASAAWSAITADASRMGANFGAVWSAVKAGAAGLWNGIVQLAAGAWSAIASGAAGLGGLLSRAWAVVTAGAAAVWAGLVAGAAGAWAVITAGASGLASSLAAVWGFVTTAALAVWSRISTAATTAWAMVGAGASALAAALSLVWSTITAGAAGLWAGVQSAAQGAWGYIVGVWNSLPGALAGVWDAVKAAADGAWNAVVAGVNSLWGQIKAAFAEGLSSLASSFLSGIQPILDALQSIYEMAVRAVNALKSAFSAGDGAQSNARGGPISGPGTGTSDSILSWLSNGEFVIKAAAVKKFGVGFFAALNNLRNPLAGFARGGLASLASAVSPSIPRYSMGGLAVAPASRGAAPFTLQIGAETFSGMTASQDAVDQLTRYASQKAVRSAGRKPSWYQG